jgi:fructose-bisphosphate aldolase class II
MSFNRSILEEIRKAANEGKIVAGFNVFGYEDALEIVRAAEKAGRPVLLMTNRDACNAMAVEHWGALLTSISNGAAVPVGVHLDHCSDKEMILRAIKSGYTSVMYDGSKLPLRENIENTREIVNYAHGKGVFVEGEIGYVPYSDKEESEIIYTDPKEARILAEESGLDLLAVSVGNIHRLTDQKVIIDFSLVEEIESVCRTPLVIHGASGISGEDIRQLKKHHFGKFNIGTAIRQEFGYALREEMKTRPEEFDRLKLMKTPRQKVYEKALEIIKSLA